jgi:hypothetical protein
MATRACPVFGRIRDQPFGQLQKQQSQYPYEQLSYTSKSVLAASFSRSCITPCRRNANLGEGLEVHHH